MPGFCEVAAVHIVLAVYSVYLNQLLQIRWRRWLTSKFLSEWLADRAYYNISLTVDRAAVGTDNPDQRISEDLRDFTQMTLSLTLDLLSNIVSLCSFIGILWGLSGAIEAFGIPIPGYMVWVALGYALVGTTLTHFVGRPLAILSFRQQRVEADFRYALVRIRENMESIALYRGEEEEDVTLRERFAGVIENWYQIMRRTKMLNSLVNGYTQIAIVFPIVVAAPRYFAGAMQLGGLMQTVGAFGPGAKLDVMVRQFVCLDRAMARYRRAPLHLPPRDRQGTSRDPWRLCKYRRAAGPPVSARCDDEPPGRNETARQRRPDAHRGPFDGDHRPHRLRQIDTVPRSGRYLAIRSGRDRVAPELVLPTATTIYSSRNLAACDHLPTRR